MDISTEIQSLFNPNPSEDEEDFQDLRTIAKVVDADSDLEEPSDERRSSSIRQRNAALLDELDSRYSGAVVNRKSVQPEGLESDENTNESSGEESVSDQEENSEKGLEEEEGESEAEESGELEDEEDSVAHFSHVNVSEEVDKGKAVRAQLKLWDSLLAARIKLQRLLVTSNRLPQGRSWDEILKRSSEPEAIKKQSHDCQRRLERLVNKLLLVQDNLFSTNSATRALVGGELGSSSKKNDDEITSEEEEDVEVTDNNIVEKSLKKRPKYSQRNAHVLLAKRHKSFEPYQNETLSKWYEKTRLASGKFGKNFQSFDQSVLKQITEILSDKSRLVKRTQLKRSDYDIVGKIKVVEKLVDTTEENNSVATVGRTYDEEIFDDDDFYQHLLRELIERKATAVTDPVALGRHWLEIQKFRKQNKKKVDTKASKGRKIRYDVQPKLVNFMAPVDSCKWNESSRKELFGSLFGHSAVVD